MNKNKIFFVTGVNGVGKTSVIQPLKSLLPSGFEIHDFDERGVPNGGGREWRLKETEYWIGLGKENILKNISTIICGFAKPSEMKESPVTLMLLDAEGETIRKRLMNRHYSPESIEIIEKVVGKSVQKFIDDNVYYSSIMRKEAQEYGIKIIDTTTLLPEQVAQKIYEYIKE